MFWTLVLLTLVFTPLEEAFACTRVVYLGPEATIITGRSMDWVENTGTDLWVFPKGMKRDGASGPTSIKWTSKYGSVIASFYGVSTVDGMNDKG
jgi:choloylglycine hydrolase